MNRDYFLKLASDGLRMPIGTDLVLSEKPNAEAIKHDGKQLGQVMAESARRWRTPLAVPLMDLTVEKEWMLTALNVPAKDIPSYHFQGTVPESVPLTPLTPRLKANLDAIRYIANETDLLPIGMSIGPFSLMTKLIADPIAPVFMAGMGEMDDEIRACEAALSLGLQVILRSVTDQIAAGAKAIFVCEPAANTTYFSPKQFAESTEVFDRYVMEKNLQLKALLDKHDVDLIFHDCGELMDDMIRKFVTLKPVLMSLGSSRQLWDDAKLVSKDIVLYGNLPTKKFYSDSVITLAEVENKTRELAQKMRDTGHPFILGSECDVLSVPGSEAVIRNKVQAFLSCK